MLFPPDDRTEDSYLTNYKQLTVFLSRRGHCSSSMASQLILEAEMRESNRWKGKTTLAIESAPNGRQQSVPQPTYPFLSTPSASLLITVPRVIRLLLMCVPSFMRAPSAPVLATRSDPAKSTSVCEYDRQGNIEPSLLRVVMYRQNKAESESAFAYDQAWKAISC
jgi:hypothetical protein